MIIYQGSVSNDTPPPPTPHQSLYAQTSDRVVHSNDGPVQYCSINTSLIKTSVTLYNLFHVSLNIHISIG